MCVCVCDLQEVLSRGGWCGCICGCVRWCHQHCCVIPASGGVTAGLVSCRLEEIDGFFARNDEEYLALIFEKEGSYLGREVRCPRGLCSSRIALGGEPSKFRSRAVPQIVGSHACALVNPALA